MTKFKIEDNPTFAADVVVSRAGGSSIKVPFVFKYFAQDELYALQEEWQKRRDSAVGEIEGRKLTAAELVAIRSELEVAELMDIVESWDFDESVSEVSMRKFVNAIKSNFDSAMAAFIEGLSPAKLGN